MSLSPLIPTNNNAKVMLKIVSPRRFGGHLSLQNDLLSTIRQTESSLGTDCKCIQVFLAPPTTYGCRTLQQEDKDKTLKYCLQHDKT